jgi:putative endonuclease
VRQTTAKRWKHEALGRFSKTAAAWRLRFAGYSIVAEREMTPFGAIDLIAFKRGLVAIVEVKALPDLRRRIEAVSARQQHRIEPWAGWLVAQRPALRQRKMRFDIIGVMPYRLLIHVKDVWCPGKGMKQCSGTFGAAHDARR